jgi:hypothetical protein
MILQSRSVSWRMLSVWTVTVAGFLLTYLTYSPGLMPLDAQDQLRQAQTGHYVDWHPPIMAWLWSQTNRIVPGPEGFFLILIGLYWGGFFLLIRFASRLSVKRQLLASILPFLPFFFNFAGTIWKDVLVFGCYLIALGIVLLRPLTLRATSLRVLLVAFLLLVGALARFNSVLAAVPIVVLLFWPRPTVVRPLASVVRRLVICMPCVLLIWGISLYLVNGKIIHAEKAGIENAPLVWDLVGISQSVDSNLLPGRWSAEEAQKITNDCYTPEAWNDLYLGSCRFVQQNLVQDHNWRLNVLLPLWLKAIADHPTAYLHVRLKFLRTLFWPNNIFVFDAAESHELYGFSGNPMFDLMKVIMTFCKSAPIIHFIFTLGFWLFVSASMCLVFSVAVARGIESCYQSLLLSLSAAAYIWPLLVIGIAGDLRYAFWSIAASCLALVIAGGHESQRIQSASGDHDGTAPAPLPLRV